MAVQYKGDSVFQVLAWFDATSLLSNVFISKMVEALIPFFQNSETAIIVYIIVL